MKRSLKLGIICLLLCSVTAFAGNRIIIEPDIITNNTTEIDIPVLWENDDTLVTALNGFEVTATGNITASFDGGSIVPGSRLDGIPFIFMPGSGLQNKILLTSLDIWPYPIYPGPLHEAFNLSLSISAPEDSEGEICIDSTYTVGTDLSWLWNNGHFDVNVSFNDGNGPVCFDYVHVLCQDFAFYGMPANDTLTGNRWHGAYIWLRASTYEDDYSVTGFEIVDDPSGHGSITNLLWGSQLMFLFEPADPGSYPVTIAAISDCPDTIEYSFTVELIDTLPIDRIMIGLDSIPNSITQVDIPILYQSSDYMYLAYNVLLLSSSGDIAVTLDSVTNLEPWKGDGECDGTATIAGDTIKMFFINPLGVLCGGLVPGALRPVWLLHLTIDNSFGSGEGEIILDSLGIIDSYDSWNWFDRFYPHFPTFNDGNGPVHLRYYTPEYFCGDANADGNVNVSDAVYIINYIFVGGEPPDPLKVGDANCDGTVNVSDAVWIQNYIFFNGKAPCDTDGDGMPDC